jgi:hypothetical protein
MKIVVLRTARGCFRPIPKQEAGSLSFIVEGYHMLLPGPWINRTEGRQRPRAQMTNPVLQAE